MGRLKITDEHYDQLKAMVESSRLYGSELNYTQMGLSLMRYRWDCLWAINDKSRGELFSEMYKYINDDHIDSALRHIFSHKE